MIDGKHVILSVEDNKENQLQMIKLLSKYKEKFKVMVAPNGVLALKAIEKQKPDLVLMDWEMPEMNGLDCLKHIKSEPLLKDIPVIMVTGMSYSEDMQTAMDEGAEDYVKKPYDEGELLLRINKALA